MSFSVISILPAVMRPTSETKEEAREEAQKARGEDFQGIEENPDDLFKSLYPLERILGRSYSKMESPDWS